MVPTTNPVARIHMMNGPYNISGIKNQYDEWYLPHIQ